MEKEIRFCFGCAQETEFLNTSSNKYKYWYCTQCDNGRKTKYIKYMYYNHTTLTYKRLLEER